MKKLLFSAAIMMIVTSPGLAGGLGGGSRDRGDSGIGDCKGCNSSAYQQVFGPPDVPLAAHPRGYPYSPGYITSYGTARVLLCARVKKDRTTIVRTGAATNASP
jgi:hypothetical protein